LQVIVGWNPEAFYAMLGERTRKSMVDPASRMNAAAAAARTPNSRLQVIVSLNFEVLGHMLAHNAIAAAAVTCIVRV
jgi:hypothetical protein